MSRKPDPVNKGQQGIALVLTLMAVAFLVAVTVQLFSTVSWQMQGAGNMGDSVQLDAMTFSGLNLVRAALYADQKENQFDSLQEGWNNLEPERISALMGQGRLEIAVTDLSGRLQVNALVQKDAKNKDLQVQVRALWLRFLTSGRFAIEDQEQAQALLDAMIDWIDENDLVEDHGAESDYYQGLSPPYNAHNGPVSYPEELLLIRGMTPEIFYGKDDKLALSQFITVAGTDGKINLNSAPPELIQALAPGIDEEMAAKVVEYRQQKENKDALGNQDWYHSGGITSDIVIPPELLTTKSHNFMITARAEKGGLVRTGTGILRRDDNSEQKLMFWEVR